MEGGGSWEFGHVVHEVITEMQLVFLGKIASCSNTRLGDVPGCSATVGLRALPKTVWFPWSRLPEPDRACGNVTRHTELRQCLPHGSHIRNSITYRPLQMTCRQSVVEGR